MKITNLKELFTAHPKSVHETYLEHLTFSLVSGIRMTLSGLALLIHGLCPFLFVRTASNTLTAITNQIADRKKQKNIQ